MLFGLTLNSLRLIARQKISVPIVLLAAAALPFAGYFMFTGDGTLLGVLRLMWGWQFYAAAGLLMLVTAYLAVVVLDGELKDYQLLLTLVKPAPRWSVLVAKFLAVIIFAAVATAVCAGSSYLALRLRARAADIVALRADNPETVRMNSEQRRADALAQALLADRQFFTSRTVAYPLIPDMVEDIYRNINAAKARGELTDADFPTDASIRDIARRIAERRSIPIPYGMGREFNFVNLPPTRSAVFRYQIDGAWRGDWGWLKAYWSFAGGGAPLSTTTDFRVSAPQELPLPADFVIAGGKLNVTLINQSAPTAETPVAAEMRVPFDGLSLLLPTGGFAANWARAWGLLWLRLCLLAAIGVGLSPIIGAPINFLALIAVLAVGVFNSTFYAANAAPATTWFAAAQHYFALAVRCLPNFDETSAYEKITDGLAVGWDYLAWQFLRDVVLRGGVIMTIGYAVFRRREIAVYRG
ncbi:hypothetical protein AGMMS49959_15820 [Planctomycetales bacterium]|nr:hypothetical protein AGMMS49959_15750 [Planctomycetales bacterium]GHV23269.1 hypothetical protein AGMMS49959_15820 [Planctomycetales bacterium]